MKRRTLAALLCLALALGALLAGCKAPEKQSRAGFFFDTVILIEAYTNDKTLLDDALEECRRYENLLSKTVEGSDVWNINHAGGARTGISPETREIIEKAQEYARLSGGRFDITIEPCVALWDFSETSGRALPDASALARASAQVDYTKVDLNDEGVLLPAGETIDLGAIAKGYITDRIKDFLVGRGVKSGILNFGGNVLAIGNKPDGAQWRVGIKDPAHTDRNLAVLPVTGQAVVTSGIYERGFDRDGVRYHHILDPATGWPVQNELSAVTIVAADAFDADALSTTVFAMGLEEGKAFIEGLEGIEALFVTRDGRAGCTSGLEERLQLLQAQQ